jgi:hypothetical protein
MDDFGWALIGGVQGGRTRVQPGGRRQFSECHKCREKSVGKFDDGDVFGGVVVGNERGIIRKPWEPEKCQRTLTLPNEVSGGLLCPPKRAKTTVSRPCATAH